MVIKGKQEILAKNFKTAKGHFSADIIIHFSAGLIRVYVFMITYLRANVLVE